MREALEEMKRKPKQLDVKGLNSLTTFTKSMSAVRDYIHGGIYIADIICMAAFRDLLDMKMLSEAIIQHLNLISKPVVRNFALLWFGHQTIKQEETQRSKGENCPEPETNGESRYSASLNQFVKIFDDQEKSKGEANGIDNRSQFSDFSLKLNLVRKVSDDFFVF